MELNDLELRAPLPPEYFPTTHSPASSSRNLKPLLCRMFVACQVLRLGNEARFTALVLLHRYAVHYYNDHQESKSNSQTAEQHWKWVTAACLFLACKTEEEPRRLRDVINLSHMLRFGMDETEEGPSSLSEQRQQHQDAEKVETTTAAFLMEVRDEPPELDEGYWDSKEQIVATEQSVLRMLKFDVLVSHPHRAVVLLSQDITSDSNGLIAVAWRRLNDALFYRPALQHALLPLACAAICLAIQETQSSEEEGGESDLVTRLGLTMYWRETYGVSHNALAAAKTSLMEATESL